MARQCALAVLHDLLNVCWKNCIEKPCIQAPQSPTRQNRKSPEISKNRMFSQMSTFVDLCSRSYLMKVFSRVYWVCPTSWAKFVCGENTVTCLLHAGNAWSHIHKLSVSVIYFDFRSIAAAKLPQTLSRVVLSYSGSLRKFCMWGTDSTVVWWHL